MDQGGLGAADVGGFALRIAAWCIQKEKTRPIMVLDEPFSHLKGIIENRNAIQMMKEISDRLGIQIISVSDERASLEEIGKGADRIFEIKIENDVSNLSTKS
jgi:ABC-type thiamine transport system ATPase subunit